MVHANSYKASSYDIASSLPFIRRQSSSNGAEINAYIYTYCCLCGCLVTVKLRHQRSIKVAMLKDVKVVQTFRSLTEMNFYRVVSHPMEHKSAILWLLQMGHIHHQEMVETLQKMKMLVEIWRRVQCTVSASSTVDGNMKNRHLSGQDQLVQSSCHLITWAIMLILMPTATKRVKC